MTGKTVQIIDKTHPFYGLYCTVVSDYGDGFLRCVPVNGEKPFNIRVECVATVVGVSP